MIELIGQPLVRCAGNQWPRPRSNVRARPPLRAASGGRRSIPDRPATARPPTRSLSSSAPRIRSCCGFSRSSTRSTTSSVSRSRTASARTCGDRYSITSSRIAFVKFRTGSRRQSHRSTASADRADRVALICSRRSAMSAACSGSIRVFRSCAASPASTASMIAVYAAGIQRIILVFAVLIFGQFFRHDFPLPCCCCTIAKTPVERQARGGDLPLPQRGPSLAGGTLKGSVWMTC